MTKKNENKQTKADAVKLEEKDLDAVQGGAELNPIGNYNFKVEIEGVKSRLTTEDAGLRDGIHATPGTKLRK